MYVIRCDPPLGAIDSAPMTSLPLGFQVGNGQISAHWSEDGAYVLRVQASGPDETEQLQWFRISDKADAGLAAVTASELELVVTARRAAEREAGYEDAAHHEDAEREAAARQWIDVTPMGGGRIAFPVGSTGRIVYRVWRAKARQADPARTAGRTRILGVRAGRSLRRPA